MNPTPRRPRFSLLPLVLLAWGLALVVSMGLGGLFAGQRGGGGFGPAGLFGAPPSPDEQARVLDAGVTRAVALANDGNSAAAEGALTETVSHLQGAPDAYPLTARLATSRGQPKLAVALLEKATLDPALSWSPNLWNALAGAQAQTGDTTGANKSAREADVRANAVLGNAGKTTPGVGPQQEEQVQRFQAVGSYFQLVKKDNTSALRACREAVRIAPDNYLTLNNLGYLLADTGTAKAEWNEALRLTRRATELAPGDPLVADSYGWALYRLGDYAGARRVLRPAVDALPTSVDLRLHLAAVYDALHLSDQAEIERIHAARLNPGGAVL